MRGCTHIVSFWGPHCPILGILKHLVSGHMMIKKELYVSNPISQIGFVNTGGRTLVRYRWGSCVVSPKTKFNSEWKVRAKNVKYMQ